MSSQIVLLPALPLVVVGIAAAGVVSVGAGVAGAVKSAVDKRVEAARKKMDAEKARLREWQVFQAQQRKYMEESSCLQEALRHAEGELSGIRLLQPREDRTGTEPTGQGYTSLGIPKSTSREQLRPILTEIMSIMEKLPPQFKEDQASPYQRLEKHQTQLIFSFESKNPPTLEELLSFKETIFRTLHSFLKSVEATALKKEDLFLALDTLLSEVLVCRELTNDPELISNLNSIQSQLLSLATSGNVKPGHLELLQKRFAETRETIEYENTNSAYRLSMAESLTRNLNEMGYETLQPFERPEEQTMARSAMSIPGGERVRIAIQPDNGLAFELSHESDVDKGSLNEEDIAFFKQQEKKWCQDFQELIRRMTMEGFTYQVKLERNIPDSSIPIVVVETAEEILATEEEKEEDMNRFDDELNKRYLT